MRLSKLEDRLSTLTSYLFLFAICTLISFGYRGINYRTVIPSLFFLIASVAYPFWRRNFEDLIMDEVKELEDEENYEYNHVTMLEDPTFKLGLSVFFALCGCCSYALLL